MLEIIAEDNTRKSIAGKPNVDTWKKWNINRFKCNHLPISFKEHVFRYYANISYAPLLYEEHRITEYAIFWMDTSLTKIIYYRTIGNLSEEEIGQHYTFDYEKEWADRPNSIKGNHYDYPRGRIFYHDNYIIEVSFEITSIIESYLQDFFMLPDDCIFIKPY